MMHTGRDAQPAPRTRINHARCAAATSLLTLAALTAAAPDLRGAGTRTLIGPGGKKVHITTGKGATVKLLPGSTTGLSPTTMPAKAKPVKNAANSVGNILHHLSLVRKAQSMYASSLGGSLWHKLVDQSYFSPLVHADKLLFFGQYASAARAFSALMPGNTPATRAALRAGLLTAFLHEGRRGHLHSFDILYAHVPPKQKALPGIAYLEAQRLMIGGKIKQAQSLLKACIAKNPLISAPTYSKFRMYRLYGETLERRAHFRQAAAVYKKIAQRAPSRIKRGSPHYSGMVTQIALATDRYGVLAGKGAHYHQLAVDELGRAVNHNRTYWPARLAMAKLLFVNHNYVEGGQQLELAMQYNPTCVRARAMIIHMQMENYAVRTAAEQLAALEVLSDRPMVEALRGRLLLKEGLAAKSMRPLRRALKRDPAMRKARGWLAGALFLQNQPVEAQKQLAVGGAKGGKINPIVWYYAANVVGERRQYKLAEKLYRKAAAVAPWFSSAWSSLAEMYLDDAHEHRAEGAESIAYHIDPFNEQAANELTLLQFLSTFARLRTKHFVIQYDPKLDTVMAHLAAHYLEKTVWPEICGAFQYFPKRRTYIEFFPTHSEFSVRMSGGPWMPCVGATTGYIIALDDPRTGPNHGGHFDWAQVLRHEFTHTVTLAMSRNRVPRWLTEGEAVYEQQAPRNWSDCEMLAANYRANMMFRIQDLSRGFVRPKRSIDSRLAYMESEWIVQYILQHYGWPKLRLLMHQFALGKTQTQAFPPAFGVSIDVFYKQFIKWAGGRIRAWGIPAGVLPSTRQLARELDSKNTKDRAKAKYQLSQRYLSDGHIKRAMALMREVIKTDPRNFAARECIGMIEMSEHKTAAARAMFHTVLAMDADRPVTLRSLGQLARQRKDWNKAVTYFTRLEQLRPLETSSYRTLAGIYLMRHENAKAVAQLNALQARDQSDDRIPRIMALLYKSQGHINRAAEMAFKAVRIDPYNAVDEALVGQMRMLEHNPKAAVRYFTYAANLQPGVSRFWEELANACKAAGMPKQAKEAARRAVQLNPSSPAAKLLAKQ